MLRSYRLWSRYVMVTSFHRYIIVAKVEMPFLRFKTIKKPFTDRYQEL